MGGFLQEKLRQAEHHLAGIGGRRAVLWLDRKAFEERVKERSGLYSYEQRSAAALDASATRQFRANKKAWEFFQAQAAWYRKTATWWVMSAKKEETRRKRLATLIEDSARGRTIPPLTRRPRPA